MRKPFGFRFGAAGGLGGLLAIGIILLASPLVMAAVKRLTFTELAGRSRLVLAGEVTGLTSYRGRFHDVGEVIFTDVKIRVDRLLKGAPGDEEITVQVLGGKIDDETMTCLESPKYELGEKVLVFLRDYNGKIWNSGWLQGKYRLDGNGAITGDTVAKGREGYPLDRDASLDTVKSWVDLSPSAPPVSAPPPGGSR
jgi:hypothetical protein